MARKEPLIMVQVASLEQVDLIFSREKKRKREGEHFLIILFPSRLLYDYYLLFIHQAAAK